MVDLKMFFFLVWWCALAQCSSGSSIKMDSKTPGNFFRSDYKFYYNNQGPAPYTRGWFKLHTLPADWQTARTQCYAEGAILASPISENFLMITSMIQAAQELPALHSGVHATFSDGVFTSVDGIPMNKLFLSWGPNEPNYNETKQCVAYTEDAFRLSNCEEILPYICFRNYAEEKLTECGTVDKAYTLDATTNHCYKYHNRATTWSNAMRICQAEGGYLAIINSEEESLLIRRLWNAAPIYTKHTETILLGYRRWGLDDHFWTVHGQTLEDAGYANWDHGEPSGVAHEESKQSCGSMYESRRLDDVWCEEGRGFICEKTTDSLLAVPKWYPSDHTLED